MPKGWRAPLVVTALLIILVGGQWYIDAVNRTHPAPWPMAGGGSGMRYYTPATFPKAPQVLWSLPVNGDQYAVPLIDADGTIYVETGTEVLAVNSDGQRRWVWRSPQRINSLALSRHGTLYAMDSENLHALDEQGRLQWRVPLPGVPASPMLVGQGGLIYYASRERLHALSDDGRHLWSHEVGIVRAGPVESSGGLILVATLRELFAVRSGGERAWSRTLGEPMPTQPVASGPDGHTYLRTRTALLVVNERGQIVGEQRTASYAGNLAVGEGVVQEGLTRRDSLGRTVWTVAPGSLNRHPSALIDGRGNALLIDYLGLTPVNRPQVMRYRLWDAEGRELWTLDSVFPVAGPAVDAKGNLCFIGIMDDRADPRLICIGDRPGTAR
ncbi:MAG: PQQ-binding-like beta-propeller repeat protein [Bacillota bacterium]